MMPLSATTERTRLNRFVRTGAKQTQNHITHAAETRNCAQTLRWMPRQGTSRQKRVDRDAKQRQSEREGTPLGKCQVMLVRLHSQATTTPKIRAAIKASADPAWMVGERYGISEQTVLKWRHRDSVEDRSHTPHRLQTTLTPAQEVVAVALRKTLLVSLDDLLAVVREFLNPNVSRSGLDRCLRRHGVGNLRDLKVKEARPKHSAFKAYAPGYLHIDVKYLPQMADQTSRRYLFVAIDRATRWVFIGIYSNKTAANARRFLRDLERACPLHIRTILTDNGKEFTDRLFGLRKRAATGKHEFDTLCTELGIDHRLTPPQSPQTNGMVERFNGRIEDVLQSHHFRSGEDLNATMHRYVLLYNQQLPQSVLQSRTPLQAMKDWHKLKPELFKKNPYYLTGCDTYSPSPNVPSNWSTSGRGVWPVVRLHCTLTIGG